MKNFCALILTMSILLALFGCAQNDLPPPDPGEHIPIVNLEEDILQNFSLYYNTFAYTQNGFEKEEYLYSGGKLGETNQGAHNGIGNSVFDARLTSVYDREGIAQGEYDALADKIGQYMLYSSTPDWEFFTFYDWYRDPSTLYLYVQSAEDIHCYTDSTPRGLSYTPLLTAWDGDTYTILSILSPNEMIENYSSYYMLAVLNPSVGSFSTLSFDIEEITHDGASPLDLFLCGDEAWILIESGLRAKEGSSWQLVRVNLNDGTKQIHLLAHPEEKVDFFLRDEKEWCWGGLTETGIDSSRLTVHTAALGDFVFTTQELNFSACFSRMRSARYSNGILWLEVQDARDRSDLFEQGLLEVDIRENRLNHFIAFGDTERLSYIRFMEEGEDGRLIDLPYASCR